MQSLSGMLQRMNGAPGKLRRIARWIAPALAAVALYWSALFFAQRSMMFPNGAANARLAERTARGIEPGAGIPELERKWIETPEGKTEYWLQLAENATSDSPTGLVVFAHGNAELIDGQGWAFEGFRRLGFSVAMCEYRGYGRSSGSPSQSAILADHVVMIDALLQRPEIDRERVVYFGRSIGTGVACALADEREPAAILLLSPFQSMGEMAKGYLAPSFLVRDPFDNEGALRRYSGPVLLMHGVRDQIIPVGHSRALAIATPHAQLVEDTWGHNDVPVRSVEFWESIEALLASLE